MTAVDLNERLYDQPFRAFRIHLSDGSSIPVMNAGMVMVSETSAILPVETGNDAHGHPLVKRWRTVALAHITQFSDVDEMVSAQGKKRG
ncbi:MAG TPA: hypothetical protein VG269_01380 [Tepidisphaeraceae bacterium]|jgi:hypothetical protein|nr:hypothetical protein [Tepidisphaeraceae bacterium]